jgi:Family of unknown function (DUF5683)
VNRLLSFLILLLLSTPRTGWAQVVTAGPDSVAVSTAAAPINPPGLSRPSKAALWGLIPGGGQVYNHDYWKVPIVYAAVGGMAYLIIFNNTRYNAFSKAYRYRTDNDSTTIDNGKFTANYRSTTTLLRGRAFFRRNRDLSIIGTALVYGMTIAEALVDAHLSTFTISDDLSLRAAPAMLPQPGHLPTPGLGLTLTVR